MIKEALKFKSISDFKNNKTKSHNLISQNMLSCHDIDKYYHRVT